MTLEKNLKEKPSVRSDTLFDGSLICNQHERGYRFSIDAVLLAHFVEVKKTQRILDLGTGCGIISLILLHLYGDTLLECSGVELQANLYELAQKNINENGFNKKNNLYHCDVKDIRTIIKAGNYDSVVCNPPFFPESSGRKSHNDEARLAKHQISAKISDFLCAAAYAVRNKGEVYCIYPANLFADFIFSAKEEKLEVKAARFIYSYPETTKGAQLVLIKCRKNGGSGLEIKSPLYIYKEKNGGYTEEVKLFYTGNIVSLT